MSINCAYIYPKILPVYLSYILVDRSLLHGKTGVP